MALLERDRSTAYHYQEIALNPMNPANRATAWQQEAIQTFRAEPSWTELTVFSAGPRGQVMHVLRPVWPTQDCMGCHGDARTMPADLLQRYGRNGMGWTLGDTVGAQVVSVPTAHAVTQARITWWWHVAATLTVFGVLFLVLNRLRSACCKRPSAATACTAWAARSLRCCCRTPGWRRRLRLPRCCAARWGARPSAARAP